VAFSSFWRRAPPSPRSSRNSQNVEKRRKQLAETNSHSSQLSNSIQN
jgi:hypothetical protein